MRRNSASPRRNWQQKVESVGLTYHTLDGGKPYWNESAFYEFSAAEIDAIELATGKLQEMCLAAGQFIIDNNRFADLKIPANAVEAIKRTWNEEPPALYGRFDLACNGRDIKPESLYQLLFVESAPGSPEYPLPRLPLHLTPSLPIVLPSAPAPPLVR
jgi:glutathionylspermidine synthase